MSDIHNFTQNKKEAQDESLNNLPLNNDLLSDPDLQDPDSTTAPIRLDASDEMQREIAGNLIHDLQIMTAVADIFSPQLMSDKALQIITTIAVEFFKRYGELPSKQIIAEEIRRKHKDAKQLPHYLATLGTLDYLTLENRQYYIDQIVEQTKKCKSLEAINKWMEAMKKDPAKALSELNSTTAEIAKIGIKKKSSFQKFSDLKAIADNQQQDFLIENWLEFGSLGMLSGLPFSGKSCIVSELVSGICNTGVFGPKSIEQNCAILSIDLENREKITVKRLEAAVNGNLSCLEGKYLRAHLTEEELPLDPAKVEQLILDAKAETGFEKILVVVDTFRSAFAANEMEVDSVKDLLYPLQRVAQRTNAAILILHHRPKSGAKYSGQTSIPGALDYLWVWESCKETYRGLLTLEGERSNAIEATMVWQFENGKNVYVRNAGGKSSVDLETEFVNVIDDIFEETPSMTQVDLIKAVSAKWQGAPSKTRLLEMIRDQEGKTLTVRKGDRKSLIYERLGWTTA